MVGSSGGVVGILPAESVANGHVPVIACYVSDDGETWLAVAQTPSSSTLPFCGLARIGTTTPSVVLTRATPGWFYYLIAVW
ncbi:MAG TPA: hypothetical protein VFN76_10130 [Candidatus Limnocylindria bacterium]|nr:hypothetical protein [Candidatus Limnocylindria bacterium]